MSNYATLSTPWHVTSHGSQGQPGPDAVDDPALNDAMHTAYAAYVNGTIERVAPWLSVLLNRAGATCMASPGSFCFVFPDERVFHEVPEIGRELVLLPWREPGQPIQ